MGRKLKTEKLPQFVPVLHQTLDCPAWNALGPHARLLYISLKRRARPETNGTVYLGVRQAAEEIGAHRNTAMTAYRELQAKGFIEVRQLGHLGCDGEGKATTWTLTELAAPGLGRASKRYLEWTLGNDFPVLTGNKPTPKKQKPVTMVVQPCHNSCDVLGEPVTTIVPPCHNHCDVSGLFEPEPVTTIVPHLESTMGGGVPSLSVMAGARLSATSDKASRDLSRSRKARI